MLETILKTTLCVSSTICLWSSFLLAYNWQEVRQRRWLSLVLFLWGLAWTARAYGLVFGNTASIYDEVLPPSLIAAGMVASVIFLVWPVSVVNPAVLTLRTMFVFCLPFIICVALYWSIIGIFGLRQFTFTSLGEFRNHISYFSVWYRLVMCACLLGYLVFTIERILLHIRQYNRYIEENYAEFERYTIRWIPVYLGGLAVISVFFFINLCFASYVTFLCHNIVACLFLAWLSAKIMVYNTPFVAYRIETVISEPVIAKGEDFKSQFDIYRQQIENWMTTERPYLNQEFNLQEVMKHFRLNRTYASKIFNDGFGKSFILVVRGYRIGYAKEIIEKNPAIAISEVAHLCGYSTVQAFHKAFTNCNEGLTPGKYALSCVKKE